MKHERAHERGKGDIGGKLADGGLEGGMGGIPGLKNTLQDTPMSDLPAGYCDYGSITKDTKSNPADMKPGMNNVGSKAKVSGSSY